MQNQLAKTQKLTTEQLAHEIARYWEGNMGTGFGALFHEEAVIIHPFFLKPISPKIAVDVMNSTVSGTSEYRGQRILRGNGSGKNDLVEMRFDETGQEAKYLPAYVGQMVILAEVVEHKFKSMFVKGYELLHRFPNRKFPFERIRFGKMTSKEIALKIAEYWGNNQMAEFNSLFSENAQIMHPLFQETITPIIASDILNSAMSGTSIVYKSKIITGDGTGLNDIIDLYAYESGKQGNEKPDLSGIMHVTLKIQNYLVQELYVHGYTAVPTMIIDNTPTYLSACNSTELSEIQFINSLQSLQEEVKIENTDGRELYK